MCLDSPSKGLKAKAQRLSSNFISRGRFTTRRQKSSTILPSNLKLSLPENKCGDSVSQGDFSDISDKFVGYSSRHWTADNLASSRTSISCDFDYDLEVSSCLGSARVFSSDESTSSSSSAGSDPPTPFTSLERSSHQIKGARSPVLEGDNNLVYEDYGCAGHKFTLVKTLLRYRMELSSAASDVDYSVCGTQFTRIIAREMHIQHDRCNVQAPVEWDITSDEILLVARKAGDEWEAISMRSFAGDIAYACRERQALSMGDCDTAWDGARVESSSEAFPEFLEYIWQIATDIVAEEWRAVEIKVCIDQSFLCDIVWGD